MSSEEQQETIFEDFMYKNNMFYPCDCIRSNIQNYFIDNIYTPFGYIPCNVMHPGIKNIIESYFKIVNLSFDGVVALCDIMISLENSNVLPDNYLTERFNISHYDVLVVLTRVYEIDSEGEMNDSLCPLRLTGKLNNLGKISKEMNKLKFKFLNEHEQITKYLHPLVLKRLESKKYDTFLPEKMFFHMENIWKYLDTESLFNDFKLIESINFIPTDIQFDDFEKSDLFLMLVKKILSYIDHDIMVNVYKVREDFNIDDIDYSLNDYQNKYTDFPN